MFDQLLEQQRRFFDSGKTFDLQFRKAQLKKLKDLIKQHENEITAALQNDLGKSAFESYATEIGIVLSEISLHLKKLSKWSKPKNIASPLAALPARSFVQYEPLGVALIIAPWNYPFQLLLAPLIGAISAGNCAVLKPSEFSENTGKLLEIIINSNFEPDYIQVVNGGAEVSSALTRLQFDLIFFTGSTAVGKLVMKAASENLVPVVLELGGKSPCVVHHDANLRQAARRIVWGKCINAGQTCIAPDYVLVSNAVKKEFLKFIEEELKQLFGENLKLSPDYGRIINERHFDRLVGLLPADGNKKTIVADKNTRYIPFTVIEDPDPVSELMQEEIFGPLLPVLGYETIDETINFIRQKPKPLAAYFFTKSAANQKLLLEKVSAGGVTINDTIMHFSNSNFHFGGVGMSGMGSYHGQASFKAFSHEKPVMKRATWIDIPLRYPPYGNKLKLVRKILK